MITIKAEWTTRTDLGLTTCTAEKDIFSNYRDVDHVEEAVNYVKKLFNTKKYNNQCVDFIFSNNTAYGCTVVRYFRFYSDKVNKVVFNGKAEGEKYEIDKLTTKEIKEAYLHTADMCMDYEAQKEVG